MKKRELKEALEAGKKLDDLFTWTDGQECRIFKGEWDAEHLDEVVYIPDLDLNEIVTDRPLSDSEIENAISAMYSARDFCLETTGNLALAKDLFEFVTWEHPNSGMRSYFDCTDSEELKEIAGITWEDLTKRKLVYSQVRLMYEESKEAFGEDAAWAEARGFLKCAAFFWETPYSEIRSEFARATENRPVWSVHQER